VVATNGAVAPHQNGKELGAVIFRRTVPEITNEVVCGMRLASFTLTLAVSDQWNAPLSVSTLWNTVSFHGLEEEKRRPQVALKSNLPS